ncbi:MAG: ATP-grasp domain-containing protein [Pirellula sp.]
MSTTWLFSTIGKRGYIADYLRQADPNVHIIGSGNSLLTPGFASCDEAVLVPSIDDPQYLASVRELISTHNINAILSFTDPDVAKLSHLRDELSAQGVSCFFPDQETALFGFDKWETFLWAQKHGVTVPRTTTNPEEARTFPLPLIRKPRFGSASVGVSTIREIDDLLPTAEDTTPYIYQECIAGEEVNVELCGDLSGRLMSISAWRKLLSRNGETQLAITTRRQDLIDAALSLGEKARIIGPCDIDIIDRDGQLFLIEFNMRFGGGYPVSHLAGANFLELLVQTQRGETPPLHTKFLDEIFMMKNLQPFGGPIGKANELFHAKPGTVSPLAT